MALLFGAYRFDPVNGILSRDGEELPLPPRAVAVLTRLLRNPGNIVSKQELLESVWDGAFVTETSLSEAVSLLRQALQDPPQEPRYIQTVHRRGYRFIAVVHQDLEVEPAAPPPPLPPIDRKRSWTTIAAAAASIVVLAAVSYPLLRGRERASRPAMARFTVTPPDSRELVIAVPSLAVSPDGRHIVYMARRGDEIALFHRDVSSFSSREIPGTRNGVAPFFSADGQRVGFLSAGQIVAVPLAGGTALPLGTITGGVWSASWGDDDSVVFASGLPSSLFRLRQGRPVERLTEKDPGSNMGHLWPRMLPGGKAVLFTVWTSTLWDARVDWLSLATGERRTVMTGASDCRFAKGMLVCARAGGTIVATPFDPDRGQINGPTLPLLRDVAVNSFGMAQLDLGGDTLTYLAGEEQSDARTLQRLVDGKPSPLPVPPRMYRNLRQGPDGRLAVSVLRRDRSDIWIVDPASGASSRLTFSGFNVDPVWSPDGRWIAFGSKEDGVFNLYRRRTDGSGAAELLFKSAHEQTPADWSPDGRELFVYDLDPRTASDVWILDLATRKMRPWLRTATKEVEAVWSPDGRWVAYASGEIGKWEVYVRGYDGGGGRWQISTECGIVPRWSADGRTLYFMRRDQMQRGLEIWAVPVNPNGAELNPGRPARLYGDRSLVLASAGRNGVVFIAEKAPKIPSEVLVLRDWPSALPAPVTARR